MNIPNQQSFLYLLLMVSCSIGCQDSQINNRGLWSPWSNWSLCTEKRFCFSGVKTRQRKCNNVDKSCCFGAYSELDNCPTIRCIIVEPTINSTVLNAPISSFISQECDSDVKYHGSSDKSKSLIPSKIWKTLKNSKRYFEAGYFNVKNYTGSDDNSELKKLIKVCFEPLKMTWSQIKSLVKLNRSYMASLYKSNNVKSSDYVMGFAIAIEVDSKDIAAMYAAVRSPFIGYKLLGVTRWKGAGYDEAL